MTPDNMWKERIFNDGLINALSDMENYHKTEEEEENKKKFYILRLSRLNRDEYAIIYKYIVYDEIFLDSFMLFILTRDNFEGSMSFLEWNDCVCFIDDVFNKNNVNIGNKFNMHYIESIVKYKDSVAKLDMIKKSNIYSSISNMSDIVCDTLLRGHYGFLHHFGYEFGHSSIDNNSWKCVEKDCMFILSDLNKFIDCIKNNKLSIEHNINMNKGVKSKRAELDSLSHFLFCIDFDYRRTLFSKYIQYHDNSVGHKKFTFKNIHMKSSNIRLYTTNARIVDNMNRNLSSKSGDLITGSKYITSILENVDNYTSYKNKHDLELNIERCVESEFIKTDKDKVYKFNDISSKALKGNIQKYILEKEKDLNLYIEKLLNYYDINKDIKNELCHNIVNVVGVDFIRDIALRQFLIVCTYEECADDKNSRLINLTNVIVKLGNDIVNRYLYLLKSKHIKRIRKQISFSEFLQKWEIRNKKYPGIINDDLKSNIGGKVVEILESCDMLGVSVYNIAYNNKESRLVVKDKELVNNDKPITVYKLPNKLPMVVPPVGHSKRKLGGYLLNDDLFLEHLIIHKSTLGKNSQINNNIIYTSINNMSKTPFKINTTLLDYISDYKRGLLIDPNNKYDVSNTKGLSKYIINKHKSKNAEITLQETILDIVQYFRNHDKVYFPLRIDQRGRVYCSSEYFNYQTTELSKALLLFHKPGVVKRDSLECMKFLKCYGVNCFGSSLSKQNIKSKIEWIDTNIENIINYDNGILLNKAKDKLLFLAFCIEYKRYYEFLNNENLSEFYTYLPIQLDATCNGFQHMALLSNEYTLFKELNLQVDKKDDKPKDFYNYLLHMLYRKLENIINKKYKDHNDEKLESYKRLSNFVWDRSNVKKAIMTIPYNSSSRSMVNYIKQTLSFVELIDKTEWYSIEGSEHKVNYSDIYLLIYEIKNIINDEFQKIRNLSKYLNNIAKLFYKMCIPITWTLPNGLTIYQSYLETKTATITPFVYSKTKITLKNVIPNKYDKNKQARSLMPNLIHSLDATSLNILCNKFYKLDKDAQFYSVHDCFGTTCDKIFTLKTMLASVYTELYSDSPYLIEFDKYILDYIEKNTKFKLDRKKRTITFDDGDVFTMFDIKWVINQKKIDLKDINRIDSQNIII